ncbi:putative uncharacterized protein [Firmicutes bacterium CAG:646]|nr:putative uncharacterized protein [Firmicutes bacterium CAG:646]
MLPTVVYNYRTMFVQALCQIVNRLCEVLLHLSGLDLAYAPGFIKWSPGNNTGMIVILFYNFHPLSDKFTHCIIRILVSGSHLAPHQHPFYITPIQESFIFNLLMFSQSIVTQSLNLLNIFDQRLLTGRCQMRIFPISLIQNQPLINRTTVQQHIRTLNANISHGKIRTYRVRHFSLEHHFKLNIIQFRFFRRPRPYAPFQPEIIIPQEYIGSRLHMLRRNSREHFRHRYPFERNRCCHQKIFSHDTFRRLHLIFQIQSMTFHIRRHFHTFQMNLGNVLTPHRFPDTGCLHIPASKILIDPALLSSRLLHIKRIFHLHHQFIFSVPNYRSKIKRKSCVTTPVTAYILTIYPNLCDKITAFKMKHIIFLFQSASIHLKTSSVPDVIMAGFILNPTHFCFISKWHLNGHRALKISVPSLLLSTAGIIKGKIPRSIQILPVIPHKLRSWIILSVTLHAKTLRFPIHLNSIFVYLIGLYLIYWVCQLNFVNHKMFSIIYTVILSICRCKQHEYCYFPRKYGFMVFPHPSPTKIRIDTGSHSDLFKK